MSKKVVTKQKANPPAPAATNGTAAVPAVARPAQTDARVAQQLRVLETVGAMAAKSESIDKFSPRTESQIKQLSDILDFYQYSRSDIATLVRRCHNDELQIQVAVANIIEDRANHEQDEWGTVKNKKQAKEEKQTKIEEEKIEQERKEKEEEKQRREAEKRAVREQRDLDRATRGKGKNANAADEDNSAAVTSLPPDPAILFAGPKPPGMSQSGKGAGNWQGEEWWDGVGEADVGQWAGKEDWNWKAKEEWNGEWEGAKAGAQGKGEEWWDGEWETAGARGKKGKDKKETAAVKKETSADMWDMPDTAVAPVAEGGLDQWTLGDLRAHERLVESDHPNDAGPKALPEGTMTLEELERGHLTAAPPTAPPVHTFMAPPTAPPMTAPVPTSAPPIARRVEGLPPPPQDMYAAIGSAPAIGSGAAIGSGHSGPHDSPNFGPDKGKGRGKGKGKGDRPERPERPEGDKERLERIDRSDDPRRQAVEEVGEAVTVRKHSSMGCAVVTFKDTRVRQAIVALGAEVTINGIKVQLKPHTNKETKEEVLTDVFVAWGRQVEKTTPLSERELTKFFDTRHSEIVTSWRAAEEEQARLVEERDKQQRQLEEQSRQEAALRERAEQRRRYEEEMLQRRQHDEATINAQRKLAEADQQRQQQARFMNMSDLQQGNFMHAAGGTAPAASQNPRPAATLGGADLSSAAAAGTYPQPQQLQQPQQQGQQAAVQQWGAAQQWMQAMAYHSQQGWQQQMAQRNMQQMQGMPAGMGAPGGQDYEALRAQATAYYAYMADQQQRQGQTAAYAQAAQAQAQAAAGQSQGGYPNPAAFNGGTYGAAASAAAYGRGERI